MRSTVFELTVDNATDYLRGRGMIPPGVAVDVEPLTGGVSAEVLAVRGPGVRLVVKQALPQLRVADEWLAKQERAENEVAAMELCGRLTPGRVPRLVDHDPASHVFVLELLPDDACNWQAEIAQGRVHADAGAWAGETLGTWHAATDGDPAVAAAFADFEVFEQQRLSPFHETVLERRPDLEPLLAPRVEELRAVRRCLVDGDYAMKNMLVGPSGRWKLDFEVAHHGNPVFDLGFFLSFVLLSAIRWEALAVELERLGRAFLAAYEETAGTGFAGDEASVTAHTACLMLARTDGKSPALFFDDRSWGRSRDVALALLHDPERGLWSWRQ